MRYCHDCWHTVLGHPKAPPGECGYDEHTASLPEGPFECDACGQGIVTIHPASAAYFLSMHKNRREQAERAMLEYAIGNAMHRLN